MGLPIPGPVGLPQPAAHDDAGPDVPVHDAVGVHELEGGEDLPGEPDALDVVERSLCRHAPHVGALQQLQHEPAHPAGRQVERADPGQPRRVLARVVREGPEDRRLAAELVPLRVSEAPRLVDNELNRDRLPAVPPCRPHHALVLALAQDLDGGIVLAELGREAVLRRLVPRGGAAKRDEEGVVRDLVLQPAEEQGPGEEKRGEQDPDGQDNRGRVGRQEVAIGELLRVHDVHVPPIRDHEGAEVEGALAVQAAEGNTLGAGVEGLAENRRRLLCRPAYRGEDRGQPRLDRGGARTFVYTGVELVHSEMLRVIRVLVAVGAREK